MKCLRDKFDKNIISNRNYTLETRLLVSFILFEMIWAAFNCVFAVINRLPQTTISMYLGHVVCLPLFVIIAAAIGKEKIFREIYFISVLFNIPWVWYCAGGNRASANIMFVCELVLYAMCLKGKKRIIFMVLSMISSSIVSGAANRFPELLSLPMDDRQRAMASAGIGASTSLLIASLLIKQKKEYMRERDAAVAAEKELEKSNQMQKNFLANMSHEIRSPLGIVLGFNTLISEAEDIKQAHEYSKNIAHAGQTLQIVINDILDYSKIESGKLDIIEADYSFYQLMDDVCTDIKLKASEKGLKFNVDIDKTIPRYLFGDDIRIKQCVLNILSNAVKYTEKGEVSFTVRNNGTDGDGNYLISFETKDTGKGIKEEDIPNLFLSFQRLDENNNRGIEGTGLGLAITKSLMDEMHGDIHVTSKVGEGSVFTLSLAQKVSNVQISDKSEETNTASLQGAKILAVDDTKLNLVLIKKLLNKYGANIDTADSGRKCIELCETNRYDIILLDHMMPEMDGVETFSKIKMIDGFNTPVVMLTANAMAGAKQEYIELGFDGYVSKPINQDELVAVITGQIGL